MSASNSEGQYVTLGLGEEVFAVPVDYVREILDYAPPSAIPEGPGYLLGLTDVRGRATPTIDLRTKLGLAPAPIASSTRILVLDIPLADRLLALGLVADRVIEVVSFTADQIEGAPDIGVPWKSEYIRGVVRTETGFVVLFDLPNLLTTQDEAYLGRAA